MQPNKSPSKQIKFAKSNDIRICLRKIEKGETGRYMEELARENTNLLGLLEEEKASRGTEVLIHKYLITKLWEKMPACTKPAIKDFLLNICKQQD